MRLRIKEIMIKRRGTSVWLANEIGVTQATISNLINDKTMLSIETLENIANTFKAPKLRCEAQENITILSGKI